MTPWGANLAWGDHVIVVGLQQTGKSTLARTLTRGARRVIYYDPKGDYARRLGGRRGVLVVRPEEMEGIDGAARYLRVVVLGARDPDVDAADEVRYVVRKVREWSEGRRELGIVLVLDELHLYSASAGSTLRSLLASGHGVAPEYGGVVSVLVSQRGVDLPLGCRALATRAYSFRQQHPDDLDRLEKEFGADFRAEAKSWQAGEPPAFWEQEKFYR